MPISCTGNVRYHVSDHLCDRHPYNLQTGFETQREREKNRVMHSHGSVAPDALLSGLTTLESHLEKLKALRVINLHCASVEGKVQFIKKGLVKVLAVVLREALNKGLEGNAAADPEFPAAVGAPKARPMVASVVAASKSSWFAVEQTAAQILRSLCAVPQGCVYVVEQGGYTALIDSMAERRLGAAPSEPRVAARTSAASALTLLLSNAVALQLVCSGSAALVAGADFPGYPIQEACSAASDVEEGLFFTSDEHREKTTSRMLEVLGDVLVSDSALSNLVLNAADVIAAVSKVERGLHLALIAGVLRAINTALDKDLLVDTAWSHASGGGSSSPSVLGKGVHDEPGSSRAGQNGVSAALAAVGLTAGDEGSTNAPPQTQRDKVRADTALLLLTALWNVGLDSVGQKEILELPAVVTNMAKVLFLAVTNSSSLSLLSLKAMAAGAIGAASLAPEVKLLCSQTLTKLPASQGGSSGDDRIADCTNSNVLDLLLSLLREATSELATLVRRNSNETHLGDGIPRTLEVDVAALTTSSLSVLPHADAVRRRELSSCVVNSVQALRLIAELPAARAILHEVFQTNKPPANLDEPDTSIAITREGVEHDLRRAIFFNTKWESEFKVYVYRDSESSE